MRAWFVRIHLLIGVQIPQHLSVIRGKDDDRIVFKSCLTQRIQDSPYIVIHPGYCPGVVLPHTVDVLFIREIRYALQFLAQTRQRRDTGSMLRHFPVIQMAETVGRRKRRMGLNEPRPDKERPVLSRPFIQDIDGPVRYPVRTGEFIRQSDLLGNLA